MEHKYTPGPWEAEPPTPDPEYGESPKYHWTVRAPGRSGGCISFQLAEISSLNCPEDEADARLIAAAPDLLEALIGLDEAYCRVGEKLTRDERTEDRKRLIAARAAIARATGAAQ